MYRSRVIPCLLLKDQGLYKTTKFKKPRYLGDPINTLKLFNDKEADEIVERRCGYEEFTRSSKLLISPRRWTRSVPSLLIRPALLMQ